MCGVDRGLELHAGCVIRGADGSQLITCELVDVVGLDEHRAAWTFRATVVSTVRLSLVSRTPRTCA
jgi:hypothetical protein